MRVSETGYRGIDYGDGWAYNNTFSINGDSKVVVLVDGKRIDNSVSSMITGMSSTQTGGNVVLDNVMDINNVDKIEVIKGPGASVYGSDATGGVINIITRKANNKNTGTIDLSTGSWGRHNYTLNYSGVASDDQSFKYYLSANRRVGGNSKYHDGQTGKDWSYFGTDYNEESAYLKLSKDFDTNHKLEFTMNHGGGRAGSPYMAPDHSHDPKYNFSPFATVMTDSGNPGYRNTFLTYVLTGGRYGVYNKNDYDVTYTFNRENGMDSFVRAYWNTRRYACAGGYYTNKWPDETIYPGGIFNEDWQREHYTSWRNPSSWNQQKARGVQLQLAHSFGIHDLITSWTYDKSQFLSVRTKPRGNNPAGTTTTERESINGYVQDKIHLGDKWELTPALRYSYYKDMTQKSPVGATTTYSNSSSHQITPVISTQYYFNDSLSTYFSWTKIYRPMKQRDYDAKTIGGPIQDEKGNAFTWGLKKDIGDSTNINFNLAYTKMSNMVGSFAIYLPNAEDPVTYVVNAKQEKKALNLGITHQFSEHWSAAATYSYLAEKIKAKGDYVIDYGNTKYGVDNMLNKINIPNQYTLDISYTTDKFNTSLSTLMYAGASKECYTDNRFIIVDWNANYDVRKDLTLYCSVQNIFNEAYQTKFYAHTGKGAYPGLGRNFMIGARYKF